MAIVSAAKILIRLLGLVLLISGCAEQPSNEEFLKFVSEDPTVWEQDIGALVERSRQSGQAEGAIVFVGSSSIRFWETLERDMHPLPVLRHGFGGAKLADVEYYAKRLINDFRPRAVVIFAGTNDLVPGATKSPNVLLESYRRLIGRVRADQPNVPIYFIGITPSASRWEAWPMAQATNRLISNFNDANHGLNYLETSTKLLDSSGSPDPDNYQDDGLHLSAKGYEIWADIIRERLLSDLHAAD